MGVSALELRRRVLMEAPHRVIESGASVSFETYVRQRLPVTVAINPVQAGSGDPSPQNPRPISGWTGANVYLSPTDADDPDKQTFSIAFPTEVGTVYGGTLNVTTGVLTVEWKKLIFTSSTSVSNTGTTDMGTWCTQSISASGENQGYGGNTPNAGDGNGLFSLGSWRYSAVTGEQRAYYRNSTVRAVLFSPEHDMRTAEGRQAFYDAIGGSAEVVYRIKTPRTYQLTPAEIHALIGINYVFSDAGDVTVEFWTN